jgi:hypothetical protein
VNRKASRTFYFVIIILIVLGVYFAIKNQTPRISFEVAIAGLENNDFVELILVSSLSEVDEVNAEEALFSSRKLGNGIQKINIPTLPDDPYILFMQSSADYHRKPKGYIIGIENNQVVYRENMKLDFQLVSPSAQSLPIVAEAIVDIISPPKQPEPSRPLIMGRMTGLSDNTIITFRITTFDGDEILWGTRQGEGPWEAIISNTRDGEDYIVSVEADGYRSEPVSYSIYVDELTAYMIEDDEIADKEAKHLDFHFVAVLLP